MALLAGGLVAPFFLGGGWPLAWGDACAVCALSPDFLKFNCVLVLESWPYMATAYLVSVYISLTESIYCDGECFMESPPASATTLHFLAMAITCGVGGCREFRHASASLFVSSRSGNKLWRSCIARISSEQ